MHVAKVPRIPNKVTARASFLQPLEKFENENPTNCCSVQKTRLAQFYLYNGPRSLHELLRLIRQQRLEFVRSTTGGVVHMHTLHRLAMGRDPLALRVSAHGGTI